MVKNLPAMQETRLDPWLGKIPREGNGNSLQGSCLDNSMDIGAWWATYSPLGHRVRHDWVTNIFIFTSYLNKGVKTDIQGNFKKSTKPAF